MLKRILSLFLSGVLLLQVSCFYASAESGSINEDTEKMSSTFKDRESDYCSAYPKNQCGNTVDVNCAQNEMYKMITGANSAKTIFRKEKVGYNCETDLYFWKYDGLNNLAATFNSYINENNKAENKHRFISEFIFNTKILLNKTSEDSAEIMKILVKKPMYKKFLEITENDIDQWKEKIAGKKETVDKEVKSESDTGSILAGGSFGLVTGAIAGWGVHGAAVAKAAIAAAKAATAVTVPVLAPYVAIGAIALGVVGLFGGNYWGKEKKTAQKLAQISKKARKKARENEKRLNVYSLAIENIFNSIQRKEYEGNDLLSAELNFDKYSPSAFIDYLNLGLQPGNKDVNEVFENLSNKLSKLIDKFNLNKEDL